MISRQCRRPTYLTLIPFLAFTGMLLWSFILYASTNTTFEKIQIHGFDVYFINEPGAQEAHFLATVPAGANFDDSTLHAGRAHLWEHVIHLGNRKYSHSNISDGILSQAGAEYDAITDNHSVTYQATMPVQSLPTVIDVLGHQLTAPIFQSGKFKKEKQVVQDEAATFQSSDYHAMMSMVHFHLRPDGHPLKMYNVGTYQQLENMSIQDLKDLFYREYQPGNMFLIVAADFSHHKDLQIKAIESIQASFFPQSIPKKFQNLEPLSQKKFPLTQIDHPTQNEHRDLALEIQSTESTQELFVNFDVPNEYLKSHHEAKDLLLEYLQSSNQGSWLHSLIQRQWVSNMTILEQPLNNILQIQFFFQLTPVGLDHRYDIIEELLALTTKLKQEQLPSEIQDYLEQKIIRRLNASIAGNTQESAEHLQELILNKIIPEKIHGGYRFSENYSNISKDVLQKVASEIFQMDQMLVATMSPEFSTPLTSKDPTFDREYRKFSSPNIYQKWKLASETGRTHKGEWKSLSFQIKKVPGVLPSSLKVRQIKETPNSELPVGTLAQKIQFQNDSAAMEPLKIQGASSIFLKIKVPLLSMKESMILHLWLMALEMEAKDQFDYLAYAGHYLDIAADQEGLYITSSGNRSASLAAIRWLMKYFKTQTPSQNSLTLAFEEYMMNYINKPSQFSAEQSLSVTHQILNQKYQDRKRLIHSLLKDDVENPTQIRAMAEKILQRVNFSLGMAGDWKASDAENLITDLRRLWPTPLNPQDLESLQNSKFQINDTAKFHGILRGNRSQDGDFAQARTWTLKNLQIYQNPKDRIVANLLERIWTSLAFQINRTEQGLGYIHSASLDPIQPPSLTLLGQTSGDFKKTLQIEKGWQRIHQMWEEKDPILKQLFEEHRQGLKQEFFQVHGSIKQAIMLESIVGNELPANFRMELRRVIDTIEFEDVEAAYMMNMTEKHPFLDVKLFDDRKSAKSAKNLSGSCDIIFTNRKDVRKKLSE